MGGAAGNPLSSGGLPEGGGGGAVQSFGGAIGEGGAAGAHTAGGGPGSKGGASVGEGGGVNGGGPTGQGGDLGGLAEGGSAGDPSGGSAGWPGVGGAAGGPQQTELGACRGVVAAATDSGVYVGWRFKATDPQDLGFNVYRSDTKINSEPITTSTNILDPQGSAGDNYTVRPVSGGTESESSESTTALAQSYIAIPIVNSTGQAPRLVGTADLDGDCDFDFVVKFSNNDQDVTQAADQGLPNETIKLEAYANTGELLWHRDLGPNIDTGVWFSPLTIFDFDGDGRAEIALKASEVSTEDGGDGDINGDGTIDYSSDTGEFYAHDHPDVEFLEIWSGATGETLARAPWIDVAPWGSDGYRYNRNMIAPAFLSGAGRNPSIIIMRGGNTRTQIEAWDFDGATLERRWELVRSPNGGNYGHNVRVGDIDGDGKDELLYFTVAIDDDGTELWCTEQAHGDRVHMTDLIPDRPGMEVFYIQEFADTYEHPISVWDATTGTLIWGAEGNWDDVGRGLAANIDPQSPGVEVWASAGDLNAPTGTLLGARPNTPNMAIWWDGDLERELLDGTRIDKWQSGQLSNLMNASGCSKGTREIPMGYGDVVGDWREEVWWLCDNNQELRIYLNTEVSNHRLYTFMQDPEYRTSIACLTMGYVQATQPSFYVGSDMEPLVAPRLVIPAGQ